MLRNLVEPPINSNSVHHFDSRFIQLSPLDSLNKVKDKDGKFLSYSSDVSVLLDQKALSRELSDEQVLNLLKKMRTPDKSSSLQALYNNMSDEQLMKYIKPRHVQSAGELIEWSKYLNSQFEKLEKEVKDSKDKSSKKKKISDYIDKLISV